MPLCAYGITYWRHSKPAVPLCLLSVLLLRNLLIKIAVICGHLLNRESRGDCFACGNAFFSNTASAPVIFLLTTAIVRVTRPSSPMAKHAERILPCEQSVPSLLSLGLAIPFWANPTGVCAAELLWASRKFGLPLLSGLCAFWMLTAVFLFCLPV